MRQLHLASYLETYNADIHLLNLSGMAAINAGQPSPMTIPAGTFSNCQHVKAYAVYTNMTVSNGTFPAGATKLTISYGDSISLVRHYAVDEDTGNLTCTISYDITPGK